MKILIPLIIVVAAYFTFFHGSNFEKDLYFQGETYNHAKKLSRGEVINHFYAPDGMDVNSAKKFIQITELSEKMQKTDWQRHLKPLINRYKLTPVGDQPHELAGSIGQAGVFFKSYATSITVKGSEHMAFYIVIVNEENDDETTSDKIDIINEIKRLESSFI